MEWIEVMANLVQHLFILVYRLGIGGVSLE